MKDFSNTGFHGGNKDYRSNTGFHGKKNYSNTGLHGGMKDYRSNTGFHGKKNYSNTGLHGGMKDYRSNTGFHGKKNYSNTGLHGGMKDYCSNTGFHGKKKKSNTGLHGGMKDYRSNTGFHGKKNYSNTGLHGMKDYSTTKETTIPLSILRVPRHANFWDGRYVTVGMSANPLRLSYMLSETSSDQCNTPLSVQRRHHKPVVCVCSFKTRLQQLTFGGLSWVSFLTFLNSKRYRTMLRDSEHSDPPTSLLCFILFNGYLLRRGSNTSCPCFALRSVLIKLPSTFHTFFTFTLLPGSSVLLQTPNVQNTILLHKVQ